MRAFRALVVGALAVAVVVTGAPGASAAPPAAGSVRPATQPAPAATTDAVATAVATGKPVVVDDLTTSTELTTALPDGRMRREVSTRPVRVQQGEAWVPVDTDHV